MRLNESACSRSLCEALTWSGNVVVDAERSSLDAVHQKRDRVQVQIENFAVFAPPLHNSVKGMARNDLRPDGRALPRDW